LREFKLHKNEELSGAAVSYDSKGEQIISLEFVDQSNAEEDQATPEQQDEQNVDDDQSVTKVFQGKEGRIIKTISIVRIK
jgi:hypothetical protein